MARDYTKYTVEGLGENLNKRQLVFAIVKDWAAKNKPSLEALQTAFPDSIQGSKGVIAKKDAGVKERDFYMDAPFTLSDGTAIVACRQWGKDNFPNFLKHAETLGYTIISQTNTTTEKVKESQRLNLKP